MAEAADGYEFFEHTADIGIRARGKTLTDLFVWLARGVTELVAEDSALTPQEARPIRLSAETPEALLLVWLQELLFWFSAERFLPVEFAVEVTPTAVTGTVRGGRYDPFRHAQGREVKAVTRHLLQVERRPEGWYGQVLVDI